MNRQKTKILGWGALFLISLALAGYFLFPAPKKTVPAGAAPAPRSLKLYWFIPDGLRAEESLFTLFQWAEEGMLPNLKKMMAAGSHGYSIPVFPGHTPTNFATLLTGATPKVHGIADGTMHIEGYPLKMVSKGGFSSVAKKVPPIWYTLEENGLVSTLLSVPGSTPPELDQGLIVRGRWGGWGVDFPAVIFHSAGDQALRQEQGLGNRVFNFGSELTKFGKTTTPSGWELKLPPSFSPPRELELANWGSTLYACLLDTSDDGQANYDMVLFSRDKKEELARLGVGQWSSWLPVTLTWELQNDYNINTPKRMAWEMNLSSVPVPTELAINVVKLGDPDFFRIRFFYNNLNTQQVKPADQAPGIMAAVGPMIDFPDNYPPQLIYYPEDKRTFLEESRRSLAWHREMAGYLLRQGGSDVIIHDIYTPNQMLTSRWWMGGVDPQSRRYNEVTAAERQVLWAEVKEMYRGIDDILGEIMAKAGEDAYVVFSSDHGVLPLDQEVRINNLLAAEGLLSCQLNPESGVYEIDWEKSQAIYLNMDNIYINPDGLGGNYHRASGPAYEELRRRVTGLLLALKDEQGVNPVARIVPWEEAERVLNLPPDRVGDLVLANKPTYNWSEDLSAERELFHPSLKSGYKQAIIPEGVEGMQTPFVIMGPGVKKNYKLSQPIRHIDQYPTIMTLLRQAIPAFVEGRAVREIMK